MSNKNKGFDTLKVLAMSIKPGQELVAVGLEGRAKQTWYSDHCTNEPNQVYVQGPPNVLRQLLAVATPQDHTTGDGFYVWGFPSRSTADTFVTIVRTFEPLSFWQVGLSRQYAVVAEYPLIGYSNAADDFRINVVEEAIRVEKARVLAHVALKEFHRRIGVSVVIFTDDIVKTGPIDLPSEAGDLPVLDYEKSEPREGGLVYKQADRHNVHQSKDEILDSVLFGNLVEARAFFAQLSARNMGTIWHFGNYN